MITGLDLNAIDKYTIKGDTDNPTVWYLAIIPSYLFARVSEEGQGGGVKTAYKACQLALKGWENFSIPFSTEREKIYEKDMDVVPISVLEQIPLKVISELSMRILEINQLTDKERKN